MSYGYTTKIQIVKPAESRDRYSSVTYDYGDAAEVVDVARAVSVQPASEGVAGANRVQVTTGWTLITPVGMDLDLSPVDRVRWAGNEAKVDGTVGRWPHPTIPGAVHHVEAHLEEVTG